MNGILYIIATPIGNLEDLTFRAKRILETVDWIACEDTRHSSILLNHYGIRKPTISFHSHSGVTKVEKIIEALVEGKSVALISDAGTPGISDPAYVLIQAALKDKIQVVPVPGPSAVVTALCASGLPTDKFLYLGFLPVKKGRQTLFKAIADSPYTVVFYESPHRLLRTLSELEKVLKRDTQLAVAKELTKIHETFFRGTVADIQKKLPAGNPKGEYVVMVKPN
ncbi:16S rRNA (cytidine(1402)-2'-O)-methyltransferase [Candidatus Peregrinibacteria bacterium]|nr:16S rRNA (cytidine(1402)-2'-O)-methyltransferase [Candidatus Peregrinibacteria bacterium]